MKLGLGSSSSNLMKGAGNRYQRHRGQALPGLILSSKEADNLQDSYSSWFAMTWAMGTALARDIFFLSTENHHRGSRAPANGNLELSSKAASFSVVPHQLRDFRQVASLLCASFISQMRVLLPDLKGCLQTWNETEFWKLSWGHMLILLLSAHLSISCNFSDTLIFQVFSRISSSTSMTQQPSLWPIILPTVVFPAPGGPIRTIFLSPTRDWVECHDFRNSASAKGLERNSWPCLSVLTCITEKHFWVICFRCWHRLKWSILFSLFCPSQPKNWL